MVQGPICSQQVLGDTKYPTGPGWWLYWLQLKYLKNILTQEALLNPIKVWSILQPIAVLLKHIVVLGHSRV